MAGHGTLCTSWENACNALKSAGEHFSRKLKRAEGRIADLELKILELEEEIELRARKRTRKIKQPQKSSRRLKSRSQGDVR